MKKLADMLSAELGNAFEAAGYDPKYGKVTLSNRPDSCEYHKAPFMIADDVVNQLKESTLIAEVESVKPGFINMKVNAEFLAEYMNGMSSEESLGFEKAENPKTIIIDYGGANVAKPLHVGHLRTAIIGESVKRIARFASWRLGLPDGADHYGT